VADPVPPVAGLNEPPDWALQRVPGLGAGQQPRRVHRLGGGTVNEVFQVISAEGSFVVRLDGAAWRRPGVDRQRELALHQVAAAAGIAPQIIEADPAQQGLLITRYEPGRTWGAADYDDVASLQRLGERLALLHQLPAPPLPLFDPLAVGESYVGRIVPASPLAGEVAAVIRRLAKLGEELRLAATVPAVVHGDLWEGNLLQGSQLWLLDWEYAQVTEPLMDIAGLIALYPVARRHQAELMSAAGMTAAVQAALVDRIDIYRILNWLWRLARGERAGPLALR
jgi:aminoglycoside phosphotransferase (APT) family kinase protein